MVPGYGRELANMAKMYTEDTKYGSEGDNFDLKLIIFYDICNRVDLPPEAYLKAFPTMLKGSALSYFYTDLIQQQLSFQGTCNSIRNHFEDVDYKCAILTEWNRIDMAHYKAQNPDKTTSQCFQLLLNQLHELRHSLTRELQTESFMLNKLVLACRELPDCQTACSDPPDTLNGLINKIKTSISAYEWSHKSRNRHTEAYMTECRFHNNGPSQNRGFHQNRT